MFTVRLLVATLLAAAASAIVNEDGTFREEMVCEVDGRLVGACRPPGNCSDREGANCGLLGGDALRCCAPPVKTPPPTQGQRSRQACQQIKESKKERTCENFPPPTEGSQVRDGDFPYFAALKYSSKSGSEKNVWKCSGSLISENFVLTVVTCAEGSPSIGAPNKVRLGDIDLLSTKGDENAQEYDIAEIIVHPEYKRPSVYGDIALVRLTEKIKYTPFVSPACLYTEATFPVERAIVAGIGTGLIRDEGIGTLKKVDVPIVPNDKCNEVYKDIASASILPRGIDSTQLCAGEKGKDTCTGDSGAPLVLKAGVPTCSYQIIGITSFGPSKCGTIPGVYTRVYSYLPWIEQKVWQ